MLARRYSADCAGGRLCSRSVFRRRERAQSSGSGPADWVQGRRGDRVPSGARGAADLRTIATLEKSMALYQTFLDKAGTDPRYSDAVERTKLRVDDIRATITFLRQGIEERRSKQSVP
jgi:hypothetical protein